MRLERIRKPLVLCVVLFSVCGAVLPALAAKAPTAKPDLFEQWRVNFGLEDPFGGRSIPQIIARLISHILPLVGALFLVMFIYGGFVWFTSGDSAERVKKAQQILVNAAIGMAIVFSAYAIVYNLITKFGAVLEPEGAATTTSAATTTPEAGTPPPP